MEVQSKSRKQCSYRPHIKSLGADSSLAGLRRPVGHAHVSG